MKKGKSNNYLCCKICVILIIVITYYVLFFMNFNNFNFGAIECYNFALVILLYMIFVFIFKFVLVAHSIGKINYFCEYRDKKCIKHSLHLILLSFLTPDYAITKLFNLSLKTYFTGKTEIKKNIVVESNALNLFFSTLFFLLLIWVKPCPWLYMFVFARLISRFLEILISFVFDVVSKYNTSGLGAGSRILLAIISFIEYYLLTITVYASCHNTVVGFDVVATFFNNLLSLNISYISDISDEKFDVLLIAATVFFNITMFTFVIGNYIESKKRK